MNLILNNHEAGSNYVTICDQQSAMRDLCNECMSSNQDELMLLRKLKKWFESISGKHQHGMLSKVLVQVYAEQLEIAVRERTSDLLKEKAVCERILMEMLPRWDFNFIYFCR